MKKLITLTIALAALMLTTGCDFDRLIVDQPLPITLPVPSALQEQTEKSTIPMTAAPSTETDATTTTPWSVVLETRTSTSEDKSRYARRPLPPLLTAEDLDDEWVRLGDEYAQHLQNLFKRYLIYRSPDFALELGPSLTLDKKYVIDQYYAILDDELKTYEDLENVFNQYCTSEYSTELMTNTTDLRYADFDGVLAAQYFDAGGFMGVISCKMVSYEIISESKIIYTFFVIGDYTLEDNYEEKYLTLDDLTGYPYTITLIKEDGRWLVADCDDIFPHGYCYESVEVDMVVGS